VAGVNRPGRRSGDHHAIIEKRMQELDLKYDIVNLGGVPAQG